MKCAFVVLVVSVFLFPTLVSGAASVSYQLAELIPFTWIEIGPGSLTPGIEFVVNDTCANITFNPPVFYYGEDYTWAYVSKQGFLSFPDGGAANAICFSTTLESLIQPATQCPFPLQISTAFGTGIALFYGFTTQLIGTGARQFHKYFSTCPYPGLPNTGCHVVQYNSSEWDGFFPTFAVTGEIILGQNGDVILQYNDVSTFWLGALIGAQSLAGLGQGLSYPRAGTTLTDCPWGNYSTPLALTGLALAFYPTTNPMPCDSTHNITFQNTTGRGCTCPDFDHDGYVCPEHDACPFDPTKHLSPGVCGCGVPDTDSDGDGWPNCIDACPYDPLKWLSPGLCGCGHPDYLPNSFTVACAASSLTPWWLSTLLSLL